MDTGNRLAAARGERGWGTGIKKVKVLSKNIYIYICVHIYIYIYIYYLYKYKDTDNCVVIARGKREWG